jgi:vacuolar-type H+-ATPase subunit E/Vma4
MGPVDEEKAALIAGIEEDARAEEKQLLEEAQKRAQEKKVYAEKKVESILADAQRDGQEQGEAVKRKIVSGVELEVKRLSMRSRDAVMQEITGRVEAKLASMIDTPEYTSTLTDWIAEAAAGLGADAAQVNASDREKPLIDEHRLSQAAQKAAERTGKPVTLTLSDAQPLKSQGVVLTAADGRTAFNNQIKTRMMRRQREIRTLIYDTLFADEQKD